ncbi:MAG: phosphoribosylamine--glycine ligase [Candidatus Micrarchaeota archaeon]
MNKFLLVGNGAREHSVAEAVCRSQNVKLFAYMSAKNPGIAKLCKESGGEFEIGKIENGEEIVKWAKEKNIELAFPSPDAVIAAGVADVLENVGIEVCAPVKAAARVEWDKNYLRKLMKENDIEGRVEYKHFENAKEIDEYIEKLGEVAIKPVGLTGGKGVKVMGAQLENINEAKKYAKDVIVNSIGGGGGVIVEEKLVGEEFTLMAFCDGKNIAGMPMVQDHKKAYEGDKGENTGGMGSYSGSGKVLPFLQQKDYEEGIGIMKKIMDVMREKEGVRYKGVMYGQFMAGKEGLKVVEINARLGDPEAMNVLPILKTHLIEIFQKIAQGKLGEMEIQWEEKATVVKYLVPDGYPQDSVEASVIIIDEEKLKEAKAEMYYASVNEKEGKIYTGKSRSIAMLGKADTIEYAQKIAEDGCAAVSGPVWHRKDIGTQELVGKREEHMKQLRG